MKKIFIFYQHISREMDACLLLKKELEAKIKAEVYIYSIDFEYLKSLKNNKKKAADIVILPWMHHDYNYQYMLPFIKANKDLIAINLHHEQIGTPVSMVILTPVDDSVKHNIYHFTWGDFYKKVLEGTGINQKNIYITGNMRLDTADKNIISRQDLAYKYNLNTNKKWILFAESRDWVWTFTDMMKKDFLEGGYTEQQTMDFYNACKKALKGTFEDFDNLTNNFFDEFELIYRPHPGTLNPVKVNERIRIINDLPIYAWLNNVDVYITPSSTSAFEAESQGLPVIVCEADDFPVESIPYGVGEYNRITSLKQLNMEIINKARQNTDKKIYEKYIGKRDNKNIARIVDAIVDIINRDDKIKMKPIAEDKKYMKTKKLFELATLIICKLGLFKVLKYPHSAYRERNDIPYYNNNLKKFISIK